MATQNEVLLMKEELTKIQEQTRKSRRRAGIGFGLLVSALVLSLIYGATQSVEAQRQRDLAMQKEKKALLAEEEAIRARDLAGSCQDELVRCRASEK